MLTDDVVTSFWWLHGCGDKGGVSQAEPGKQLCDGIFSFLLSSALLGLSLGDLELVTIS